MAERTILLKGERQHIRKEGIAGGAIRPGQTVVLGSAGTFTVGPAAGAAPIDKPLLVALEYDLKSHETSGAPIAGVPIDVAYAANDRLLYASCPCGVEFYALVAPSAAAIVKGDSLEYNSGYLRKATTGTVKAVALEAVDNSADAVNAARIIVEAI